jgi:hypothetical protein
MVDQAKKAKLIKIGIVGGSATALVLVIVLVLTMKKKTSSISSSTTVTSNNFKFPTPYYNYVMGTENISNGVGSFYLGGADPSIFDAQWCIQSREQLTFEPVSDGVTADTKIYRIRQATIINAAYLTYDSTAGDFISQLSYTTNSNQLWAVKHLSGVTTVHLADVGISAYLGVYSITNVGTGLALSYVNVSGTNKITAVTPNASAKNQQWCLAKAVC